MNDKNIILLYILPIFVLLLFYDQELKAQQSGCAHLFQHTPSNSVPHLYCGNTFAVLGGNDNEYSTMTIGPNTECILSEHPRFAGRVFWVIAGPHFSSRSSDKFAYVLELPPGRILNFNDFGWDNRISSVACMPSGYFRTESADFEGIELFEHGWFSGKMLRFNLQAGAGRVSTKSLPGWDNQISSLRIGRGVKCVFYEHPNYKGDSIVFPESGRRYWSAFPYLEPQWNDKISSYTCFRVAQ